MYEEISKINRDVLFQGDIVRDFPFPFFLESIEFLKPVDGNQFEVKSDGHFGSPSDEIVKGYAKKVSVMLISQTCDIQRRERISICPLLPISAVPPKNVDTLKKRKGLYYWFYLPEFPGLLGESIADLQSIVSLPSKLVLSRLPMKIMSLSHWGRHHLCWALQNYFARPIEDLTPDVKDAASVQPATSIPIGLVPPEVTPISSSVGIV